VRRALLATLVALVAVPVALAPAHRLPNAPRCPVFPASSPWNARVDRWTVAPDSGRLVRSIGLDAHVHADFGSGRWQGRPIGIPVTVVGRRTPRVPVAFDYAAESDRGRYPIPSSVRIEGGSDRHAVLVDRDACRASELFALRRAGPRAWAAGSGAVWDLRSNRLRPRGWTSADAAGLPILPGLARPADVGRGGLDHALRFTAPRTRRAFVFPARHFASDSSAPALPPMGTRIRLRRGVSLRGLGPQARAIAVGLKRYGALLADNGAPWFFSGVPDRRWRNDDLHGLGRLSGRDFEVVRPPRRP
jgi:hypothetical protein